MLRYGITKIFDVPIRYAYTWCTDFRNDDPVTIGGPYPRHIFRRKRGNFVWIQRYKRDGVEKEGVRLVTLKPPNAWHSEAIDDEKERVLDYRLAPVGKDKTKLTITVRATYKTIEPEAPRELERILSADWDKYKAAVEEAYSSGKAASA